jgi:putative ABC transport system permease protein
MRKQPPAWLTLASALYRLCARLASRAFRERFGRESEDDLRRLLEETAARRGQRAALATAAAAYGDLVRVSVADRSAGWRRGLVCGLAADTARSIRVYWREPLLTTAIVFTLALVSGPTLAIYGVLYHVLLAPLPYPDATRLFVVAHQTPRGRAIYLPAATVADYRKAQAFSSVGGAFRVTSLVTVKGQTERVQSARATAGLLTALGVPFVAGRDLRRGGAEAVVSRGYALRRFGGDAAALDQPLGLGRRTVTIVGVIAYQPPLPGPPGGLDLFIPHDNADQAIPGRKQSDGQAIVIARLRPDSTPDIARHQITAIAAGVRAQFGGVEEPPQLLGLRAAASGSLAIPLLMLFGAVVVVFLLAATSLASLVLARAGSRAAEVAVRRSLGASGWRLIRQWLVDGLVFAWPGAALGAWLGDLLMRYGRTTLPPGLMPLPEAGQLPAMAGAALILAVATAGLFAYAPIVAGLLRLSAASLKDGAASIAGLRRVRSQSVLIVGQVALSLVLVASTVWLTTSLRRTFGRPLGFDADQLVMIQTRTEQPRPVQVETARRVLDRLRQLDPDAASRVAAASDLPGVLGSQYGPLRIRPDQPSPAEADRPTLIRNAVSTDYFRVLGIRLLEGRDFSAEDEGRPERVIVVSRSFRDRWFPEGALGRTVSFVKDDRREIIGVVDDVQARRLSEESPPQFYVPMTETSLGSPSHYLIRTTRPIEALGGDITRFIRDLDSSASVVVMSARDMMAVPLAVQSVTSQLTAGLALVALLLAVVNVYALSAFAVLQRSREIGIRVALGARPREATGLVMRRALLWIAVGLALGAAVTILVAAPMLKHSLFDTSTGDPRLLALAVVLVGVVAGVASWLPARRVARIDPAIALRAER